MALTVTMPQLGESVTEGTIARWLKQPGDAIAKYESIAEVITDKVNAEIPAPADGVMSELIAPEGTVVPVGQPICSIETGAGGRLPLRHRRRSRNRAAVAAQAETRPEATPAAASRSPSAGAAGGGRECGCARSRTRSRRPRPTLPRKLRRRMRQAATARPVAIT